MPLSIRPTESDLVNLLSDLVPEGTTLDYKLNLSVNNDEDKREFLADVVSFANTAGGHLVIGMNEEGGLPTELPGIQIDDPDKTKLRLESMIQDGISRRIAGVAIHSVKLSTGSWVISIYVPKSWSAPHMVTFKNSSRFYARHSSGKYQLDIQQIRDAILLSESIEQKIRDFRLDRVSKIRANEVALALRGRAKIVLHLIPLSAYQSVPTIDFSSIPNNFYLHSNDHRFQRHRFNLDGVLFHDELGPEKIITKYKQVFRNGNFEYVDSDIMTSLDPLGQLPVEMPSPDFERELIKEAFKALEFQKRIAIEPPIYVFMSFTDIKGVKIGTDARVMSAYHNAGFDRDVLLIPEVTFESYPSLLHDVTAVLKPAFDAVWNAAGWPHSINYRDGVWMPKEL